MLLFVEDTQVHSRKRIIQHNAAQKNGMYQSKKKIIASSSFPKNSSKILRQDSIIGGSGPTLQRHSSFVYQKPLHKKYDKGGVQRIFSTIDNLRIVDRETNTSMDHNQSACQCTEPSAPVSCSCLSRIPRRLVLQNLALTAIKENKIFSVYGSCEAVRTALLERGWIEKIPPSVMLKIQNDSFTNKTKKDSEMERIILSNLVEKCIPNFVWGKDDILRGPKTFRDKKMTKECNTIINKLESHGVWTTKQGLCSSMKRNYWFYIEDVAEVNCPRTYNSYDDSEIEGFVKDYKITACTSLLKWIITMVTNERPVFVKSGRISIKVLLFALNRCKEYLFRKQHKDIDIPLETTSSTQWSAFLKNYYRIIAEQDVFKEYKDKELPLYLDYAKFLLKEIHKFRPQLSCEGYHNIWIIKPACCSRGRGIRMASKLGVITNLLNNTYDSKYVIQKYIEEPLLIHDTKFDIRQYYLVTSTFPLVIWMYTDCYLKFSSQKYSLKNYHESIHLTNNAVQRRYKNCKERHSELPRDNMWDSEEYKNYLKKHGKSKVWDSIIYPGMKKSIIGIMLSCQDFLNVSKNRFELYGCDFILDKEYKPWLIEINSCPDLKHTTQVTAKICSDVVSDIVKVIVDYASNTDSSTGKFECIYHQPISKPRYYGTADLVVRGYTLPLDYFYRGNVKIQKSNDDPDIRKERELKSVLSRLRLRYDPDIIVQPDDDERTLSKHSSEALTCDHNTHSENELTVAATVINELLDELIDRFTFKNRLSSKSDEMNAPYVYSSKKHDLVAKSMQHMTDIETLPNNPYSYFASLEALSTKQSFFSELDDESQVAVDFAGYTNPSARKFKVINRQPVPKPQYGGAAAFVVAGYTLPLNYFQRRNVKIKESNDDQEFRKDSKFKAILTKLKHFFDTTF